ncbi:phosphoadenosine phosphosulfate reductase [Streptomyces drozdowiczii]|uniref:Phosphoadenosine phosphosulfate reductase n=1 Tax=Streptomyces drozdowiczii TaxID=202862 RepID=A0ABY6PP40_9ACTN|nr:phosphoadenosine phosphosulfate reductase [Streptomyces drozdowiczii]MCX0246575.1 phosphoadenosine phosphosulfate reductase [Streptomyces drozdowiczii]UZK53945.1 phosphoadenosine phosphosulfate reductase [Streptomyces drozdowiczii]
MTEFSATHDLDPIAEHEPQSALRVISYGGGVQSTALLALAAEGVIDFPTFLFSNVGDDSENPGTLRYIREVTSPFAREHGISLEILEKVRRDGRTDTLWQVLHRPAARSIPIPVRMANGAPGRRNCTADFKIKVISKWLKAHGASADRPATVGIGISVDEIHRANRRRSEPNRRVSYPLLDLGLRREDCIQLIREAGLPIPPKSSCFFCPFHTVDEWRTQRKSEPELFSKSEELERFINSRRAALGRDDVYLTRYGAPLGTAIHNPAADDLGDGNCDSGWCMT